MLIRYLTIAGMIALCGPVRAQEGAGQDAALRKAREQIKTLTTQLRTAQAERATSAATLTTTEAKLKEVTKEKEDLNKKLIDTEKAAAEDQAKAKDQIAALGTTIVARDGRINSLMESLAKWKTGFDQAVGIAKKKESERAVAATKIVELERRVLDRETKNLELYKTGTEVLDRYENYSLGKALLAKEPFTQLTRVKIQGLVQDYRDKLTDNQSKSQAPPKGNPGARGQPVVVPDPDRANAPAAEKTPSSNKADEPVKARR